MDQHGSLFHVVDTTDTERIKFSTTDIQYENSIKCLLEFKIRVIQQLALKPVSDSYPPQSIDSSFMSLQNAVTVYTNTLSKLDDSTLVGKTLSLFRNSNINPKPKDIYVKRKIRM